MVILKDSIFKLPFGEYYFYSFGVVFAAYNVGNILSRVLFGVKNFFTAIYRIKYLGYSL